MKKVLVLVCLGSFSLYGFNQTKAKELKSESDSASYALGVTIGGYLKQSGFTNVNEKLFEKALQEQLKSQKTLFDDKKANEIIGLYLQKKEKEKGSKNVELGKKFLEENKKKPGVIALPSGLQYKIITEGSGAKPIATDKVTVHYHGTLIDGRVFDSSVDRKEPIQLSVSGVIPGWTEALQLMGVGSKWTLYIPSELGYGDRSMPGSIIEPSSVLVFDVELISIDKE